MKNNCIKSVILYVSLLLSAANSFAQTAITAATTVYSISTHDSTYTAPGATGSSLSGNTYTYNFGTVAGTTSNDQALTSFTAGGTVYSFLNITSQYVRLRRVNNAVVSGTRNLEFSQGDVTGSTVNMNDFYDRDMENLFLGNQHFNSGTDNLFGNQGDGNGNNNDIERVDVIFPNSITANDNSKAGFAIFERGDNGAHDPVKVAAILGLDVNGVPNSYSSIISISSSTYGTTDVVSPRNYIIMRRDTATEPFKMSTTTSQAIGGVLFKYSDFGIANNTPIYGYSIIPDDFPSSGTAANIPDYTNTTYYPTNSSSSTGAGGIDLIAITGILQSASVVSFPISGNVYDDANALQDGTVNGTGTNAGGVLYAQLLNSSNAVISTVTVNSDGTYIFPVVSPGTYSIVLDTSASAATTAALPAGYINTGENNGAGAGSDGTPNGIVKSIVVTAANVTNINFGIEQLPAANTVTAASQANPGGTIKVSVPTLNGSDPEQGSLPGTGNLDTLIINTLPSNGTLYYNNVAVSAGDTIKNYNPSLLTIDPNSGIVTVSFTYSEVDAALQSSSPATVTMPFIKMGISGNVFDDANGLMDNTVNGTGTNAGGLNAVLITFGTGKVTAVTTVAADGTYSFSNLNAGNYNIEITTKTATVASTAPAVSLPAGWLSTGENVGTGAGSDGTVNGILTLGSVSNNITNADFGIEQVPASDNKTYTILMPAVNSSITLDGSGMAPGALSGSDPEDGTLGNNKTVIITSIPTNVLIYYNGALVTSNTTINNYDPSKLQLKFISMSALTTSFQYEFVDAANNDNATPATYLISWTSPLPVVLSSFNAEKENDYSLLTWTTSSELNVKDYNVERSIDNGKTWETIGEVIATGNSSVEQSYSYTDPNPESGTNLYRLQIEDDNGSTTYSHIKQIDIEAGESSMTVYPNPVGQDEALNIQLVGLKAGAYKISMVSSSGQTVKAMTFTINNSGSALLVIPTASIARGSYVVTVIGSNMQFSKTVIVANR